MSTETARPSLHHIGYRRAILALGACWGAVPALSFGVHLFTSLSSTEGMLVIGALMTLSLGALYELDSRTLDRYGNGVQMAWSYALVVPISAVAWAILAPLLVRTPLGLLGILGILVGPPMSALLYLWVRGRYASVERT